MKLHSIIKKEAFLEKVTKRVIPKNNKGMSVGDIYPVMLTIALVAILIAIVLLVLTKLSGQMPSESATVVNETLTVSGTSISSQISTATKCGFGSWNATRIINATLGSTVSNETLLEGTDYTINTNGTFMNLTELEGSSVWATYNYSWRGKACESTTLIATQISDFVPWIGIILLVIAAAIVIGVLIRNLAGGRRV